MSNPYIKHDDTLDVRDIANTIRHAIRNWDTEDERLDALEALKVYEEAFPGTPTFQDGDWEALADAWGELDGPTAIAESYFTEYTEEYLKELGYLPQDLAWFIKVDWEKTAEHVKADYTEFELEGTTYLIRLN